MVEEVRSCAATNTAVEYLGLQTQEAVYQEMRKAKFLIFPSEWFETFGRTVIEAFSQGTPVLATDLGAARELVEEGVTGYRFLPGNVDTLVERALSFPTGEVYQKMRTNCRSVFLGKFTAEINYTILMDIYTRSISTRKNRG
jgi:glycosyltransferase involved in cell wall biosynthesis